MSDEFLAKLIVFRLALLVARTNEMQFKASDISIHVQPCLSGGSERLLRNSVASRTFPMDERRRNKQERVVRLFQHLQISLQILSHLCRFAGIPFCHLLQIPLELVTGNDTPCAHTRENISFQ